MSAYYSIHEYLAFHKVKVETIKYAHIIYDHYVRIIKLRFKEWPDDERQLFLLNEADRWLQMEHDKENDRISELYKDEYYADEYDHSEDKYGLDN